MVKILIVEDNEQKFLAIQSSLKSHLAYDAVRAATVKHAINLLSRRSWDILVLDMAFEDAEGIFRATSKEPTSGVKVLSYLDGAEIVLPTIVVTQHDSFPIANGNSSVSVDDLRDLLMESFEDNFRALIKSSIGSSDDGWLFELMELVAAIANENP